MTLRERNAERLREQLTGARALEDSAERARRLHQLGQALSLCESSEAVAEGRQVLLEAAALGSPYAANDAALMLLRGDGGSPDPNEARVLLEHAARGGLAHSALLLGKLLLGLKDHAAEGLPWLQQAAEAGEAEAFYLLGLVHSRGLGSLPVNHAQARALHRRAADAGLPEAAFELSLLLEQGLGGPVDADEARRREEQAASAGYPRACFNRAARFARTSPPDMAQSVEWYERAAKAGHAEAAARLCRMYLTGQGVPADEGTARHWFAVAASLGYDWDAAPGVVR